MAALEDVRLVPAEEIARDGGPCAGSFGEIRQRRAAVVAGEDDQRVVGDPAASSAARTWPTQASTCMTKSA